MRILAFLGILLAPAAAAWGQSLLGEDDSSPYDPPPRPSLKRHDFLKIVGRRFDLAGSVARSARRTARAAESPAEATFTVTAEVVDVRPNGTLVVQAVRRRRLGSGEEVVRLAGEVAPASVKDGSALLEEVQNLSVVYEGPGRAETLGIGGSLSGLLARVWPF